MGKSVVTLREDVYSALIAERNQLARERDAAAARAEAAEQANQRVWTLIDPASAMAASAHDGSRWFDEADIRRALAGPDAAQEPA